LKCKFEKVVIFFSVAKETQGILSQTHEVYFLLAQTFGLNFVLLTMYIGNIKFIIQQYDAGLAYQASAWVLIKANPDQQSV
jgi:hypothetical protein